MQTWEVSALPARTAFSLAQSYCHACPLICWDFPTRHAWRGREPPAMQHLGIHPSSLRSQPWLVSANLSKISPSPKEGTKQNRPVCTSQATLGGREGEATCRQGSAGKKSLVNPSAGEVAAPPPPALAVSVRSGALHSSGTLPVCLAHLLN